MSLPMDIRLPPEFLKKLQPENENSPLCKPLSRMSRRASLVCDIRLHRSARLFLCSRSQTLIRLANASTQMLTFSFIFFALIVSLLIHSQKLVSLLRKITFVSFLPSVRHRLRKTGDICEAWEAGRSTLVPATPSHILNRCSNVMSAMLTRYAHLFQIHQFFWLIQMGFQQGSLKL